MERREFLRLAAAAAGAGALGGCASENRQADRPSQAGTVPTPTSGAGGQVRFFALRPRPSTIDLGGPTVATWTYGDELPGREIRVRRGETIEAVLDNGLPAETSVHWHGIALPNAMDGQPGVTQPGIPPGGTFTYRFVARDPGTYFFHPHSGLQLDRGVYAPLIVEDPDERGGYDHEWVVVLDDWLDGVGGATPDTMLAQLRSSPMQHGSAGAGGMGGMDMGGMKMGTPAPTNASAPPVAGMLSGARSAELGGDPGDVAYPHYLINGRIPAAPRSMEAKPRQRVRLRLINAAGDTAFRVALGGHRLKITHTDGFPVVPVEADTLLIGMGERYDVEVTLGDGVFPLVALAEGKIGSALALIRTGAGRAPGPSVRPKELNGELLRLDRLKAAEAVVLPSRTVDREHRLELRGGMGGYEWTIGGVAFGQAEPLEVTAGQRVRLAFTNTTTMWHPMHLHGHTFAVDGAGTRKDTVAVLPDQTVTVDFEADNPGKWMVHCHNVYHQEAGMMRTLAYT